MRRAIPAGCDDSLATVRSATALVFPHDELERLVNVEAGRGHACVAWAL